MTSGWTTVGSVEINRVRLGLRESGDPAGTPVVLLHGTGSSATTWDRFVPRLTAAGYRTIAVDLRGHAGSDRPGDYALRTLQDDLVGLLDTFELRDAVLIGHSVGGYAALGAALEAPGRIARLVLEDLAAPPRETGPAPRISPFQILAAATAILRTRRDYDLRALTSILRQLTRADPQWWDRLGDVGKPTLVLSGGPASCIPPGRLFEATAAIPGARLTTIPVGHRVHSLAPDRFAVEVLNFLGESLGGTAEATRRQYRREPVG